MSFKHLIALAACSGLLLAAPPALAQSVGVAAAVNPSAHGTPPTEKTRTLTLGDKVIHNEQIETDAKGLLQILLADGTSFTVGPNSKMSIDSFVYDPGAGTAQVSATLSKGLFRFIGGKTSKTPDGVALTTPVGTVGIRGGIADIDLGGVSQPHIDMRFGDNISLSQGGKQVGFVFQNGYSIVIGDNNQVTVEKTPPAWTTAMQSFLSGHQGQHGGAKGSPTSDTLVASRINDLNPTPPNPPTDGALPTGDLSDQGVRLATWEEINNSSLGNVTANYAGLAIGTVNSESQYTATGTFSLDYSFGSESWGELSIDIDHRNLQGEVSPDASTGLATFTGDLYENCECYSSGGTVGAFLDQGKNIGSAVVGTFNAADGNWSVIGAYGGTYTGPSTGE